MVPPLRSRYFALRHGISEANEQGIIVSRPEVGCNDYGLSKAGFEQAEKAQAQIAAIVKEGPVVFVTSDFKRARETAETASAGQNVEVRVDTRLRERFFGDHDLKSADEYNMVWAHDKDNADNTHAGVESPNMVVQRASSVVMDLEKEEGDAKTFILTSHGDCLQLLQTWFRGIPANEHRSLPHLNNCELRLLNQT